MSKVCISLLRFYRNYRWTPVFHFSSKCTSNSSKSYWLLSPLRSSKTWDPEGRVLSPLQWLHGSRKTTFSHTLYRVEIGTEIFVFRRQSKYSSPQPYIGCCIHPHRYCFHRRIAPTLKWGYRRHNGQHKLQPQSSSPYHMQYSQKSSCSQGNQRELHYRVGMQAHSDHTSTRICIRCNIGWSLSRNGLKNRMWYIHHCSHNLNSRRHSLHKLHLEWACFL